MKRSLSSYWANSSKVPLIPFWKFSGQSQSASPYSNEQVSTRSCCPICRNLNAKQHQSYERKFNTKAEFKDKSISFSASPRNINPKPYSRKENNKRLRFWRLWGRLESGGFIDAGPVKLRLHLNVFESYVRTRGEHLEGYVFLLIDLAD